MVENYVYAISEAILYLVANSLVNPMDQKRLNLH